MKKFSFNLEKILNLRSWMENDAKIELGQAVRTLSEIENKLAELAVKRNETAANQYQQKTLIEMQTYQRYLQFLDAEKERLLKEAAEAQLQVEKAQEAWMQTKADLKVMENLKDRRLTEYKKEIKKE